MALVVTEQRTEPASGSTAPAMALARAAAQGDSAATGQLLRALAPRLGRVVRAVLGGGHPDLDDAIQQSLIGLVQALPAFRGIASRSDTPRSSRSARRSRLASDRGPTSPVAKTASRPT